MKSEPESRLEKGIDMKVRLDLYSVMLVRWVGGLRNLLYKSDDLEPIVKGEPTPKALLWPHILPHIINTDKCY